MPLAMPGVLAGMIFAFVHSFDDVNLSLFIARPGERPLTVAILGVLEFDLDRRSPRSPSCRC